ncbi:MAG: DUF1553 domain-containing protein, partial [Planctomycetes bacterium]|nr:DUF1553 domain-containing protein [Planctomycetota bacterium]
GDSGPAIVPGKVDESLIVQAIRYGDVKMPPTGRLPANEIQLIEQWVKEGAIDPRRTEFSDSTSSNSEAASKHWAFQPVVNVLTPEVSDSTWPLDDVDRFILSKLDGQGLKPQSDTDRYTWLRRVSLDLTGLPPSPEEIEQFVADSSPQSYQHVVDRLLASRGYGERWARHWLDLVGFADQIGTANNLFAEHAWRYRDYVIQSFLDDKPFDRFLSEQICGDLMTWDSIEQRVAQLTATGFLLLGDLTVVEADKAKLRVDVVDQQVDKIGKAMLGMTLACARCHDHKFDPISQHDYYATAGIFYSTESIVRAKWGVWSWPSTIEVPETESQIQARQQIVAEQQKRIETLKADREILQTKKSEIESAIKNDSAKNESANSETKPANPEREKELKEIDDRLKKLDTEITHAEFFVAKPPIVFAVHDDPKPQDMRITIRGNPHTLGESIPRGAPASLGQTTSITIPDGQSGRKQFAEWIVARQNPLTARVAVNRIWQKLYGEGLVRSVDYWGLRGDAPTYPELLDHLATRFVSEDWSQKRLIRSLVLSRSYRLSSQDDRASQEIDPENRWIWRMNRRRLDAEALRDSMLAVSGKLMTKSGGPGLPLEYPENVGGLKKGDVNPPSFRLTKFRPEQSYERTVYLPIIRSGPQSGPAETQNVFDFTQPGEFSGQRSVTAVPTQSLFLMNSQMMKERSNELAARILSEVANDNARIKRLWLMVFNRPATDEEVTEAESFMKAIREQNSSSSSESRQEETWSEFCHALLASNEFLMKM